MMSSIPFLVIGIIIGAVLGYVGAVAQRGSTIQQNADQITALRTEVAQWQARTQSAEAAAARENAIVAALSPIRTQIEQMGVRVETMERQRANQHNALAEQLRADAQREAAQRGELSEQLRTAAQRETELARMTASLEGALRSRSARGTWGEVELARILEVSGMMPHVDFSEQRSIGAVVQERDGRETYAVSSDNRRSRPDVTIHLPGEGFLALDAKAPMDSYLRACAVAGAGADAERERRTHFADHAKALRAHINALAKRDYARALGKSPALVVLFVPSEAALSAALHTDPTLLEHGFSQGVALSSPVTLLALTRTCASAWAHTAINDQADEIIVLGRTLYERMAKVAQHLDRLGKALEKSVKTYNDTVASVESRLLVTVRSVSSLTENSAKALDVSAVSADGAQVRTLSAPELTSGDDDGQ
jgi:rmuC family protein